MSTEQATPEQIAQEDAAFAAGFNQQRGIANEPPAETTAAPAASTETAKQAEPVDEWAGVPPKVKSEFESLGKKLEGIDKVSERLRNFEGQLGGVAQATKEIRAALAQAKTVTEARGADAPTQQQVQDASQSDERWKQLKEDYPDWADAVDARLARIEATSAKPVDSSALKTEINADIDKRIAQVRRDAAAEARILARIDLVHEGWEETVRSPAFEDWISKQPQDIQDLAASPKATDAIRMLDLFKVGQNKGPEKDEREARLKRATAPNGVVVQTKQEDPEEAFAAGFNGVRRPAG